ncbi:hypothetical protein [Isoptericola halotolerans]|uniref:Fructose/tagatose bisphosphate aldolase n=1 Tax=Isoptericola halotolerans TaxID=300560 RepID=A0ABX2A6Z4_9MICO|nr:hypothetical protein [Isoptericola halotolerans]NOV97668.1 fructose/tagatose bisphosphate aldolase [Isoptericola halotolerans]
MGRTSTTYTVTVTYTGSPDPEDDTLAVAIGDYHATISEHPLGHTEVVATLDEPTIERALSRVLSVLHGTRLRDPITLEVRRTSTNRD